MDNLEILSFLISKDPLSDSAIKLPRSDENIFERIIRDPNNRWANERRCSEMLSSVLINTNGLRNSLLHWLGKMAGQTIPDFDKIDWSFKTEEQAEGKRIDLTIKGVDRESEKDIVSWMLEIKVKSPMNKSSPIGDGTAEEDDEDSIDKDDVDQLLNYDKVLEKQEPTHKAGYVLSLRNAEYKLPKGLNNTWKCTTWTGLGLEIEKELINNDKLTDVERFLGRHMLGFIRNNLWRNEEMETDTKLTFEDVALIKATYGKSKGLQEKLKLLVSSLEDVIKSAKLGSGKITYWSSLFTSGNQVGIFQEILPKTSLMVAFASMEFMVWIEAGKVADEALELASKSVIKALQKLDKRWRIEDDGSGKFEDLCINMPLEEILGSKDQLKTMREFVVHAVDNLKSVKIIDTIKLGQKKMK